MTTSHPLAWKRLRSEEGPDLQLFRARFDWMENPRNAEILRAVILEAHNWVNIVAITPDEKILMVEQYRFGAGKVTIEIPAGVMEPDETPEQAARRELQEETGYTSAQWTYLGWVEPNPAFMNNRCHQWLARQVQKTHLLNLDAGEAITVRELPLAEVRTEITAGNFRNSLGLLALAHVFNVWEK
jgi:ADP-ribose pyrophosphatase